MSRCTAVRWAGIPLSLALVGYGQRLPWHCFQETVPEAAAVYPLVQAEPALSIGELIDPRWLAWAEQLSDQQTGADESAAAALPSPSSKAAARTSAAVDSGMLDMSAFGSESQAQPARSLPQPKQQSSAVDTGMLDMSAFGIVTEPEPAPPPQQQQSAMDTGMLDMSAFGFATEPEPAPPPQQSSAVDTGMLDMSAFGLATEPEPAPQQETAQQQQQQSALDTGMLDMSAFGLTTEPEVPPQQQLSADSRPSSAQQHVSASGLVPTPPQLPPVSTAHGSALETGRLDMAAFGGGGNGAASSRTSAAHLSGAAAGRQPQRSTAPTHSLPSPEPLSEDELAVLRQRLGVPEDEESRKRKGSGSAERQADASAFSLLRLDAPESAMRDADNPAAQDAEAANGHTTDAGSDAAAAASAETGPTLPGLSRSDSLRVLRLVQLAVEAAAGAAGGTAAQFLSSAGPSGGVGSGSRGGGQAAALDAAPRRAVLALRLGMLLQEAPQAPQGQGQNDERALQVCDAVMPIHQHGLQQLPACVAHTLLHSWRAVRIAAATSGARLLTHCWFCSKAGTVAGQHWAATGLRR